ncbi:PP2C family serine/threonine-protein phosphatase [Nocardiopsis sp. MG754419]|uniref:PP2C family protein-serine/threonine phosphatase n=1 Tax=Nocardiopsis sp. MG754419 TaxID=2259865 RepID=UPI001BA45D8C|nr:phosphatase [Nocardiopsis sp. MG754419]MBR8744383.1 phosphatase [Nocardiopsis sp. MG754419]
MHTPVIATDSDQGPRRHQEDAYAHQVADASGGWRASLADGFGDHPRTRDAAALAAITAIESGGEALDAVLAATRAISRTHPGADCVMVHARQDAPDDLIDIAWVGDCRLWTWSSGEGLRRHTRDHTFGQRLRDRWVADDLAQAGDHALTTSVATAVLGDIGTASAPPAELVLFTTDGVHDYVDERLLAELVVEHAYCPDVLAHVLVDAAREAESGDNATAMVIRPPLAESPYLSRQELLLDGLEHDDVFGEDQPALLRLAEDRAVGIACDRYLSRDGATYWCTKDSDHTDHHVSWHGVTWA